MKYNLLNEDYQTVLELYKKFIEELEQGVVKVETKQSYEEATNMLLLVATE